MTLTGYRRYLENVHLGFLTKLTGRYSAPTGASASNEEIDSLATRLGVHVCEPLREFFVWIGHDVDGLFRGTECLLDHFEENVAWLPELFAEMNVPFDSTGKPVCFYCHQGYIAYWYHSDPEVLDPRCWTLADDGVHASPTLAGTVSEVLSREVICRVNLASN